ncbi:DUF3097 domain-containing protein [Arcanobacterium bovis]|uniref:DUF3097 domain-containing protein n=1 Tax=Arcanobacterium bovis TaxID=2529275 RepID=A0A4Q9V0R9_9ACTO|nr:DUF3097 domain-containing protein [Arcanobacterium bovis]
MHRFKEADAATPVFRNANDRYGDDVLRADPLRKPKAREIPAEVGLLLEDVQTGYVGEVVRVSKVAGQWQMVLEDGDFKQRSFPLGPGFWVEGEPVVIVEPKVTPQRNDTQPRVVAGKFVTASGSLHVDHKARVARPSRIWVEGKHDAQLISKIWGEDLAYEGIMIEELYGADHLIDVLKVFGPSNDHRAGVLLDHLVPGSKEWRIAQEAMKYPGVLVLGHPYIDVWQAIKPRTIGIASWPNVPRGEDIKSGTLARLGWPHANAEDIGIGWQRMLDSVHSYTDLEPALLGRMEELIDFVSAGL